MANITGTGDLVMEEMVCENTGLAYRWKDVAGTGALVIEEMYQEGGTGLKYVDGEILGHLTDLVTEEMIMSGTGKADNLAGIPRATCVPMKAKFHTCNTTIKARFRIGG